MELLCASCRKLLTQRVTAVNLLPKSPATVRLLGLVTYSGQYQRSLHTPSSLNKLNQPKLREDVNNEHVPDLTHPPRNGNVVPPLPADHSCTVQDSNKKSHDHTGTNAVDGVIQERHSDGRKQHMEGEEKREEQDEKEAEEEWAQTELTLKKLPSIYLKLSKSRLTALVVLTSLGGYTMAPGAVDPATLLWAVTGTALCSASANSFNQWMEVPYDSLMTRTKNRVLVRKRISPQHALLFGITTGIAGSTVLLQCVNPLTAALGIANIILYAGIYTPLKRVTIANTWVGSVVGAIPPLMGWSACTGSLEPGAFVLAGILFAWQFSHFNALSWSLRSDYNRAGYQMMSVTHPDLCRRVALRYSLATIPICTAAPLFDVTTWWFAIDSLPVNLWLSILAWRFYRDSDFKSSRKLFYFTLFHLPLLMGLMLVNKKTWSHSEDEKR